MSFGSRLDEAITMRGITQRKFAKMVGTSEVSISRYISGERNPKMPTAIKMADILNVSLDWLAIDESERKVGKKADVIEAYQKGWNDAIDAMQNAKFVSVADRKTENSSEKPNNCETCKHNKLEWFSEVCDGCSKAHSNYEPQNYCDDCLYNDTCDSKEFFYACTSKATKKPKTEPHIDNSIGCSRCEGRYDCPDRDMPNAVRCNNYGKITDEPQTDCAWGGKGEE